jgi:hypothetical protein
MYKYYLKSNRNLNQKFLGIKKKELRNDLETIKKILNYKNNIEILEIFPNQFILFSN